MEQIFPTKQASLIRKRWNSLLKVELLQAPWSSEEDDLLRKLVAQYGIERQWKKIAEKINSAFKNGAFRQSRQCRERWFNYVDTSIKRGKWSFEEDLELMRVFVKVGKKWSAIAKLLGDRTENAVKNRWKSLIRKETHHTDQLNENLTQVDESYEIKIAQVFIEKAMADCLEQKARMNKQETGFSMADMMPNDSANTSEEKSSLYSQNRYNEEPPKQTVTNNVEARNYSCQPLVANQQAPANQPVYYNQNQFGHCDYTPAMPFYGNFQEAYYRDQATYNQWMSANQAPAYNYPLFNDQITNLSYRYQYEQNATQNMSSNATYPFKLSQNITASQEFKRKAKEPESQVFYALVDINSNVIQVLDKVSETNRPQSFGSQSCEQNY